MRTSGYLGFLIMTDKLKGFCTHVKTHKSVIKTYTMHIFFFIFIYFSIK